MTLARRIATPRGGLIALALGATIAFFAILTTVEQACGDCGASITSASAPDLIADAPAPAPSSPAPAAPTPAPAAPTPAPAAPAPGDNGAQADTGTAEQADKGTSEQPAPTDKGASEQPAPADPGGSDPDPSQPSPPGSPLADDVSGAANYVRAFYADLAKGDYKAAWPRLASDLRGGGFDQWRNGFASTVSQSTSPITAKAAGPNAALVTLTLTAVDKSKCGHEVERHFAVTWRLALADGKWAAQHASARPLGKAPTALVASC